MALYSSVLIDTLSIQQYIFSSNKLRENLGASHIIEYPLYKSLIPEAIRLTVGEELTLSEWWEKTDKIVLEENLDRQAEIGYIGGGNSMVLFREPEQAIKFVNHYSILVLENFPGVQTALGIFDGFDPHPATNINPEIGFQESMEILNTKLRESKFNGFVQVSLPKSGIVKDCPFSNESQEYLEKVPVSSRWVSGNSKAKLDAVSMARKSAEEVHKEALSDRFSFTNEIGQLGQPDEKGYVGIVHFDGNGLGKRFKETTSLAEFRTFSKLVDTLADNSMKELVKYVANRFPEPESESEPLVMVGPNGIIDKSFQLSSEKGKYFLPVRPLIRAGDDITFVTEGRLAIHLGEKLIQLFEEEARKMAHLEPSFNNISGCAGIAIVKTKYPFYKAYQLAEELIGKAKQASRGFRSRTPESIDGSFINFMISASGFSGSLEEIIETQYTINTETNQYKLFFGPYPLPHPEQREGKVIQFDHIKSALAKFKDWPRTKMMALRDNLRSDVQEQELFKLQLIASGHTFPKLSGFANGSGTEVKLFGQKPGFSNRKELFSPWFDIIELADFYPDPFLPQN